MVKISYDEVVDERIAELRAKYYAGVTAEEYEAMRAEMDSLLKEKNG